MTNLPAISIFSVLGAPGIDLSYLADPIAASQAMIEADVLSADATLLFEAPNEHLQNHFKALEAGELSKALAAKGDLVRQVRQMTDSQWEGMVRRAQLFGENELNRFAAAVANAGIAHQIQTAERKAAEGENLLEAPKALGMIAARAAFGSARDWNTVCDIAGGESPMAQAASLLLDRWEELMPLAAAPDRLTFARMANALVQKKYEKILEDLFTGRVKPDNRLAQRLEALVDALGNFLDAIDSRKAKTVEGWGETAEGPVHALLHDGAYRMLDHFIIASEALREGRIKILQAMALSGRGSVSELLGLARTAVLKNILGLAAKGIKIDFDIPEGIEIADEQRDNLEANLAELINNAVKYSQATEIHITWNSAQRAVIVTDNGIGISDTQKAWEEGQGEGTGLGLAMVKRRAEETGWKIKLLSTPGEGATFKLFAPAKSVAYAKSLLEEELEHQREHQRQHQTFDFSRLFPEVLSLMTAEEQLEAGKQALAELEGLTFRLYNDAQKLEEGDLPGLKELIRHHTNDPLDLDKGVVQKILDANRNRKPFQDAMGVFRDGMTEAYRQATPLLIPDEHLFVHELLLAGVRFLANGRLIQGSVPRALSQSRLRWAAFKGVTAFREELLQRGVIKDRDDPIPWDKVEALRQRWEGEREGKIIPLRPSDQTDVNPLDLLPDGPDDFDWLASVLQALLTRSNGDK